MNHQDLISSYVDNELSTEVEQEFLISLAASEGLRRSFRSELVLKNILHRDESSTRPPRELRGAVFSSIGLGAMPVASGAASASRSIFGRALAGVKMNILATSVMVTLSAGAGYLIHDATEPVAQNAHRATEHVVSIPKTNPAPAVSAPVVDQQKSIAVVEKSQNKPHTNHGAAASLRTDTNSTTTSTNAQTTTSLSGGLEINPQVSNAK